MAKSRSNGNRNANKPTDAKLLGNAYIRAVNRATVLDLFRNGKQLSRSDISRQCDLTKPTVSAIVDSLVAEGVLKEAGMGPSDGGRRALLLEINPISSTFVGIHFGEDTTQIAVTDALGRTLAKKTADTVSENPDASMETARVLVNDALRDANLDMSHVTAAGVSVPGLVDRQTGNCKIAPNLGWHDYPISERLAALLGVDVYVANTTQTAALAEHQMGVARGLQNFVWLYVGSGVGSCAVIGGRIQLGTRGFAGEIGHCKVETPGLLCGCGKRGCLETTCSNLAIAREARKAIESGRPTALAFARKPVCAKDVSLAASEGDMVAQKIMTDAGRALGLGVSLLLNIYDPQMVVVGGPVAGTDDFFLDGLKKQAAKYSLETPGAKIVFSNLGSDIYLKGAVQMAMEKSNASYRIIKSAKTMEVEEDEWVYAKGSRL
ncbi:MAG: ROK family transcriptional regulator [Deltaproteobacteria bacterium]|nr:ROK family transcriptional regulator [Deltaproteobacteria bacterium]MBN2671107.1 ROK family transcriptional regulator [Deltaproteobacteria bacterium]